jgi:hypothetical protein
MSPRWVKCTGKMEEEVAGMKWWLNKLRAVKGKKFAQYF